MFHKAESSRPGIRHGILMVPASLMVPVAGHGDATGVRLMKNIWSVRTISSNQVFGFSFERKVPIVSLFLRDFVELQPEIARSDMHIVAVIRITNVFFNTLFIICLTSVFYHISGQAALLHCLSLRRIISEKLFRKQLFPVPGWSSIVESHGRRTGRLLGIALKFYGHERSSCIDFWDHND